MASPHNLGPAPSYKLLLDLRLGISVAMERGVRRKGRVFGVGEGVKVEEGEG
jgi:hypothetical protein